jgi:hypothetical protein
MYPEYPCAHCTVGGAAPAVLELEFGNAVPFSISTEAMPDMTRHYQSFAQFAEEETYSRILGGVHYRNSWMTGATLGRKIGAQAITTILRAATLTNSTG